MKIGFLKEDLVQNNVSISTHELLYEAQMRGDNLYHFRPQDLVFDGREVFANMRETKFEPDCIHFSQSASQYGSLNDLDVIVLRLNPPFDKPYYMALAILEHVDPSVLVLNNPHFIKNFLEKLCPFDLTKYAPRTLVTADRHEIKSFIESVDGAVLKPLNASSGDSVFFSNKNDANQEVIIDSLLKMYGLPIVVQEVLDIEKHGDKRIFILDGEPVGAYLRRPKEGSLRANSAVGGSTRLSELTDRDLEICMMLKPELQKREIFMCGLDVIGDKVTEVNVRNPAFSGFDKNKDINVPDLFWDKVMEKMS